MQRCRKLTDLPTTCGSKAWLIRHSNIGVFGSFDRAIASNSLNISDSLDKIYSSNILLITVQTFKIL